MSARVGAFSFKSDVMEFGELIELIPKAFEVNPPNGNCDCDIFETTRMVGSEMLSPIWQAGAIVVCIRRSFEPLVDWLKNRFENGRIWIASLVLRFIK